MEVERVEVGMGESVYVVEDCERVFSVGELVEYWVRVVWDKNGGKL